jgi:hypothetical protein
VISAPAYDVLMTGTSLVRATMLISTMLWAMAEVLKIRRPFQVEPARSLWTAGLALAVAHAAIAFAVAYGWSHEVAARDTARQTAAVTGIVWDGGIFVNYVFIAAWFADALWWWLAPAAYLRRPAGLERARAIFFLVMFVSGAIVFAGTAARLVGVPAVAAVCLAWLLSARRRAAPALRGGH